MKRANANIQKLEDANCERILIKRIEQMCPDPSKITTSQTDYLMGVLDFSGDSFGVLQDMACSYLEERCLDGLEHMVVEDVCHRSLPNLGGIGILDCLIEEYHKYRDGKREIPSCFTPVSHLISLIDFGNDHNYVRNGIVSQYLQRRCENTNIKRMIHAVCFCKSSEALCERYNTNLDEEFKKKPFAICARVIKVYKTQHILKSTQTVQEDPKAEKSKYDELLAKYNERTGDYNKLLRLYNELKSCSN